MENHDTLLCSKKANQAEALPSHTPAVHHFRAPRPQPKHHADNKASQSSFQLINHRAPKKKMDDEEKF